MKNRLTEEKLLVLEQNDLVNHIMIGIRDRQYDFHELKAMTRQELIDHLVTHHYPEYAHLHSSCQEDLFSDAESGELVGKLCG